MSVCARRLDLAVLDLCALSWKQICVLDRQTHLRFQFGTPPPGSRHVASVALDFRALASAKAWPILRWMVRDLQGE